MIINQPHNKQLGIQIIEALENDTYSQLTIMVAYAKLSGVYRLLPYIKKFRQRGGVVRIVVGIDQQNTTYDALLNLLNESDQLSVYHSEALTQTFHIKCYWLQGSEACWYAVGSNNLTAGGLFSNYELSAVKIESGDEASKTNSELEEIYQIYSQTTSVCVHIVSEAFLSELLEKKYVVKEIEQRKALAETNKKNITNNRHTPIFGKEVFPAPALPDEFKKKPAKKQADKKKVQPIQQVKPVTIDRYENDYLIRHVPKAGGRSKQVHFTIDLLKKYFCLDPGDGILVQEMLPSGEVGQIEQRQIVFSERNRNVKIELSGAEKLDTEYPSDESKRPILVIKRVNANLFVYMLIMDGDHGYDSINDRLLSIPKGRSLAYEVLDESTMFSLWSECPIL